LLVGLEEGLLLAHDHDGSLGRAVTVPPNAVGLAIR
jgi:hypothetical protein